jgi:molybdopterin-containing oxidoreductase family membrane subunit
VAGAIYSGFAMVLTLAIPLRKAYGLEDFITMRHLNNMAKVMLATGLIVAYGYAIEAFMAFYGGNQNEVTAFRQRIFEGPYRWFFWALILFNVVIPQLLWFRRVRGSVPMLFVLALVINVGMWLERFVIVVSSLARGFMQSKWQMYYPTRYDWGLYVGTIGLFVALLFLFIRFLPMISAFEMRELVARTHEEAEASATTPGGVTP